MYSFLNVHEMKTNSENGSFCLNMHEKQSSDKKMYISPLFRKINHT